MLKNPAVGKTPRADGLEILGKQNGALRRSGIQCKPPARGAVSRTHVEDQIDWSSAVEIRVQRDLERSVFKPVALASRSG